MAARRSRAFFQAAHCHHQEGSVAGACAGRGPRFASGVARQASICEAQSGSGSGVAGLGGTGDGAFELLDELLERRVRVRERVALAVELRRDELGDAEPEPVGVELVREAGDPDRGRQHLRGGEQVRGEAFDAGQLDGIGVVASAVLAAVVVPVELEIEAVARQAELADPTGDSRESGVVVVVDVVAAPAVPVGTRAGGRVLEPALPDLDRALVAPAKPGRPGSLFGDVDELHAALAAFSHSQTRP